MFNLFAFFPPLPPILKWHEHMVAGGGEEKWLIGFCAGPSVVLYVTGPLHVLSSLWDRCYFGPVLFPQWQGSSSVLPGVSPRPWQCSDFPPTFPHYHPPPPTPPSPHLAKKHHQQLPSISWWGRWELLLPREVEGTMEVTTQVLFPLPWCVPFLLRADTPHC